MLFEQGDCKSLGGTAADLPAGESRSWPKAGRIGKGRKGCIIRGACVDLSILPTHFGTGYPYEIIDAGQNFIEEEYKLLYIGITNCVRSFVIR